MYDVNLGSDCVFKKLKQHSIEFEKEHPQPHKPTEEEKAHPEEYAQRVFMFLNKGLKLQQSKEQKHYEQLKLSLKSDGSLVEGQFG